jgi:hypothetical protein
LLKMEENKNDIVKELKEVAPLIGDIGKHNPYSVPADYFTSLTESIFFQVRLSQLKIPGELFSVPNSYFENLADSILFEIHNSNVKNELKHELSEIAPLLNTINKENIFSVPSNYFEQLSSSPPSERKTGRIISFPGKIRKWVTYAAAASILFIIATSSYLYVTIHSKAIEKHLPIEQRIAELNEEEIINYLKENDVTNSGDLIPATNDDPQIQHMLQRVSDEEIENYLDEHGDQNKKSIKGI